MKKFFVLLAITLSTVSVAGISEVWTDSRGNEWAVISPRTTFARAQSRCHEQGMRLANAQDFLEAVDEGMLDPKVNENFGEVTSKVDWVWVRPASTALSFRPIAWKYGEVVHVPANERHWALCESQAN